MKCWYARNMGTWIFSRWLDNKKEYEDFKKLHNEAAAAGRLREFLTEDHQARNKEAKNAHASL